MHKNKMVNRVVCFSPKSHSKDIVCLIVHGPQVSVVWVNPLLLAAGYVLGQVWEHCYNLKMAGERLTSCDQCRAYWGRGRTTCTVQPLETRADERRAERLQNLPFMTGCSTRTRGLRSDVVT